MGLTRNTIGSPPVTLDEAKQKLRIATTDGETDITDDDDELNAILEAATDHVERYTGRQFRTATYTLTLDEFPDDEIVIPRAPLVSVQSISYLNTAGQSTAHTGHQVDASSIPGRIFPPAGSSWPSTDDEPNAVTINYTAGIASADDVPATVKRAILLFCELEYDDPEPAKAARIEKRIESLVRGLIVRDARTVGGGD